MHEMTRRAMDRSHPAVWKALGRARAPVPTIRLNTYRRPTWMMTIQMLFKGKAHVFPCKTQANIARAKDNRREVSFAQCFPLTTPQNRLEHMERNSPRNCKWETDRSSLPASLRVKDERVIGKRRKMGRDLFISLLLPLIAYWTWKGENWKEQAMNGMEQRAIWTKDG